MVTESNRSRALWVLAAVTAIYGLFNVFVFYTQDNFGAVWFATSLVVYGALAAGAVWMAIVDTTEVVAVETPPLAGLDMLSEDVIYSTETGQVIDARFAMHGKERSLLFTVTEDEVLPVTAVEERLDAVDLRVRVVDDVAAVDKAIERRRAPAEGGEEEEEVPA